MLQALQQLLQALQTLTKKKRVQITFGHKLAYETTEQSKKAGACRENVY
jgi:hypothetical protein